MAEAITVGSIIYLQQSAPNGVYLDTYGWVAAKPEFANVAGTERIFVSTCGERERGGGTTRWQLVSAGGKADGAALLVGDRVHLRNMYPDAGFLDCCGWIEHLAPFAQYAGKVRCGVFTAGAPNRDNGTGVWTIRAANKQAGEPLLAGDAVLLVNGYPENKQPADSARPETGSLVAYGEVAKNAVFADFKDRLLFVFTSTDATTVRDYGTWMLTLAAPSEQQAPKQSLFDFFRPELLKGRTHNMESVSNISTILLLDAFQAISGVDVEQTQRTLGTQQPPLDANEQHKQLLDTLVKAKSEQEKSSPDVVDYDFQVKQLWNLFTLTKTLHLFDRDTLQGLMLRTLTAAQDPALPPLDLVRSCFRCIAADHEIIQRATVQRRWNKQGASYYQSEQALELVVMDKLALKAVKPFQHLLQDSAESLAVITYFSETTHIHHLPYTKRFLLVGVNYDRISPADSAATTDTLTEQAFSSFELMAIPHEVGHYIYQHGRIGTTTFDQISEAFRANPYRYWCEEIFADVYGCIVAGPLSVFSMQAFLTSGDKARAWRDDDEHPTPILRPFMLSEILRVLGTIDANRYAFSAITDMLDGDWAALLQQWEYDRVDAGTKRPARLYVQDVASTQLERIINVERVMNHVRPIIETFARLLLGSLAAPQPAISSGLFATNIPWSHGDNKTAKEYAREMALLTAGKTASETVPLEAVLDITTSADATKDTGTDATVRLQWYVDEWGDKGPLGSSGGTHR